MIATRPDLLLVAAVFVAIGCESDDSDVDPPKAAFSFASDNNFLAPTLVTFSNESTGAKEYLWDFGDGSPTSNNINPSHQYHTPGKYAVTLIASNETLVNQVTKEINIGALPLADFSFESDNFFQAPTTLTFTNNSQHAETFQWDFGDGQYSTEQHPTHEYTSPGDYVVELIAKNEFGQSGSSEEVEIIAASSEQSSLQKLLNTWTLTSAILDGTPRTSDFAGLVLTISGTFTSPGGTYTYSFTGTRPNPSPWPASGTWKFDADPTLQIIRLDDGQKMNYSLENNDKQLIIQFNYQGAGFAGGRIQEVAGNWEFVFGK